MSRKRIFPTTTGYYVYVHITPDKMCYFGMSGVQPYRRWKSNYYRHMSLQPYIKKYSWKNIEHMVIQDGLTKHQAEVIEDWFITKTIKDSFCINQRRSGGIERDKTEDYVINKKLYNCKYRQRPEVKEHHREYMREYRLKKKALKNE